MDHTQVEKLHNIYVLKFINEFIEIPINQFTSSFVIWKNWKTENVDRCFDLLLQGELCDQTIIFNDNKFYIHKIMNHL